MNSTWPAPRDSASSPGAAAGKEIENADAGQLKSRNAMLELVEDRLADAIGSRAGMATPRRRQGPAAQGPADDPHRLALRQALAAELLAQHARMHLLDRAARQLAQHERAERHPDQPVDLEPEMLAHLLDFAVLALAQAESSQALPPWTRSSFASIGP